MDKDVMRVDEDAQTAELIPLADKSTELVRYDPHEGLKALAVAEAAEKHFQRAKDATALFAAVEAKLGEQRRLVVWHDQELHGGEARPGGDKKSNNRSVIRLPEGFPDPMTLSRWRKRLKDPKKYDATLETAQERCRRICEADKGATAQKGASGTGLNEWYTPPEHLSAARDVLGEIDLDPASSDKAQEKVQAKQHFTIETDGLSQDWHGRVWLNPPYAQPHITDFVSKMVTEYRAGRVSSAIMLTHNYTDTAWFHEAESLAEAICFTRGRVKFYNANGETAAPTQGQAFFYFGNDSEAFAERFSDIGFVVKPVRR